MTINAAEILFQNQTVDGTGNAVNIEPDHPSQEKDFHLALSGSLGGGTFTLLVSFDNGATFVSQLLDGVVFGQVVLGYDKIMSINTPIVVNNRSNCC